LALFKAFQIFIKKNLNLFKPMPFFDVYFLEFSKITQSFKELL